MGNDNDNDNEVKKVRPRVRYWNSGDELNPLRYGQLTRAQVEAVCDEYGPDHAWIQLGVSRSTLYKWRRDWRKLDAQRAALDIQGDQDGYPGTTSIEEEKEPQ